MLIKYNNYLLYINKDNRDSFIFQTSDNYFFWNSINLIYYNYNNGELCFYYYLSNKTQIYLDFNPLDGSEIKVGVYDDTIHKNPIIERYNESLCHIIYKFLKIVKNVNKV